MRKGHVVLVGIILPLIIASCALGASYRKAAMPLADQIYSELTAEDVAASDADRWRLAVRDGDRSLAIELWPPVRVAYVARVIAAYPPDVAAALIRSAEMMDYVNSL